MYTVTKKLRKYTHIFLFETTFNVAIEIRGVSEHEILAIYQQEHSFDTVSVYKVNHYKF